MLLGHRSAMILLFSALGACAAEPAVPPSAPAAGSGMPTLERRPLSIAENDLPDGRYFMFDVGSDGSVVFISSEQEAPFLRRVDSTGRRIASFGRGGEGPGETRSILNLRTAGDTILVYDDGRRVLIETDLRGKFLRERPLRGFGLPLAWHTDSIDQRSVSQGGSDAAPRVMRSPIGDTGGRVLLDMTDPLFAGTIDRHPNAHPMMVFSYAATDDRYWLADPWSYQIRQYSPAGTLLSEFTHALPPNVRGPRGVAVERERLLKAPKFTRGPQGQAIPLPDNSGRLDTLERESIPHFTRTPLHVDEFGRLWVIGLTKDSTSVDLFQDTTFVGRAMLPCYPTAVGTRAALGRGGWLVLECEVEEGDWPTELQLYRILERPKP